MNGSDERYGKAICEYLDRGAAELKPGLAYRLQQARSTALDRLAGEATGAFVGTPSLAGAGGGTVGGGGFGRPLYANARLWIAVLILAAGAFGWQQWNAWQELEALEDLDAQLLTSELPIDAYVDRGFQQWLRTAPPSE